MLCHSSPPLPCPSPHPTLEDPKDFPEVFRIPSNSSPTTSQHSEKKKLSPPQSKIFKIFEKPYFNYKWHISHTLTNYKATRLPTLYLTLLVSVLACQGEMKWIHVLKMDTTRQEPSLSGLPKWESAKLGSGCSVWAFFLGPSQVDTLRVLMPKLGFKSLIKMKQSTGIS